MRAGGGIEAADGIVEVWTSALIGNSTGPTPGNGGALHATAATTDVRIKDSIVAGNTASSEGGGVWNSAGYTEVSGSTFTGNVAQGAEATNGGGALFNNTGDLLVEDSRIEGNSATGAAGSGGGIFNELGTLTVTGSEIVDNDAVRAGGGIETNEGSVTLTDVDTTDNDTGANPGNGGGLHVTGAATVLWTGGTVTGNDATAQGGGLWNSTTGTITATGLSVEANSAPEGPDTYNDGGTFTLNGQPVPES